MVSQIALTKSKLTWLMPPHFSTVTVTAYLAASLLHFMHMMQEGVRPFCLPLSGALWRSMCMCLYLYMCWCTVCVHTACGWLFVLNGHLYSSFISTSAILQHVCVLIKDKCGSLRVQTEATRFV